MFNFCFECESFRSRFWTEESWKWNNNLSGLVNKLYRLLSIPKPKRRWQRHHFRRRWISCKMPKNNDLLQKEYYMLLTITFHNAQFIENANKRRTILHPHFFFSFILESRFFFFVVLSCRESVFRLTFRFICCFSHFDNEFNVSFICWKSFFLENIYFLSSSSCLKRYNDNQINERTQRWNFLDMKSKTITSNCRMDGILFLFFHCSQ